MLDRKIAEQATKNRILNGNRDFLVLLFMYLSFPLFLFYSSASMLFCFEHVSGSICFLTGTDVVLGL